MAGVVHVKFLSGFVKCQFYGGLRRRRRHTVLCIAVKVAVFYQQVMKLTQNYDFYDFPIPVYARKTIYIKNFGNFGYTDTHFTWQNPTNLP